MPFTRFDPIVVVGVEVLEAVHGVEGFVVHGPSPSRRCLIDLIAGQDVVVVPVVRFEGLTGSRPLGAADDAVIVSVHGTEAPLVDWYDRRGRGLARRTVAGRAEAHAAGTGHAPVAELLIVFIGVHDS